MKKIAVFFRHPDPMGSPLDHPDYLQAYIELSDAIKAAGGQMYMVRTQESYLGHGKFLHSWRFEDGKVVETGPLVADVVFDKGRFQSDNTIPKFNETKVCDLCEDKWLMYEVLHMYCPKSVLVHNEDELKQAFRELTTSKVVYKPRFGGEGRGVRIADKSAFFEDTKPLHFPGVVQEFLNTSQGFSGIASGTHDLRVAIVDGEIFFAYVRMPPVGSLQANVSLGGSYWMITPEQLPLVVKEVALHVDTALQDCRHRYYSIDFGITEHGLKIIEMNSEIGLDPNYMSEYFVRLKKKLAQILMDM